MRAIFDKLSNSYAEYYSPTKRSAGDEIIVLFKGRVIFKRHIPKKYKRFGIKPYKLCDSKGYTYNTTVYLRKDRKRAIPSMAATCATVTGLTARIEHVGHKLYMDNFVSSPALFDDLHTKTENCCGTVRPNRKGMLKNFGHEMKMKRRDLETELKGNLRAIAWKDRQNANILTNMHSTPIKGNFCDEHVKAMQLAILPDYTRNMGYVDKSDCMTNSYSISRWNWKWTKKLFFQLMEFITLNSFFILASCSSKLSH
jgi:hypothetical protein